MQDEEKGLLIVISGPSGVGKGTVCRKAAELDDNVSISVSATTRQPRTGEVDGLNYHFYSKEKFLTMIDNKEFLEWAVFCDNYYGTPKQAVFSMLDQGKDVILEIDVQGALKVRSEYPEGVYIFMLPPSLKALRERITERGTEAEEVIDRRMEVAVSEIAQLHKYNYLLVNNTVDDTVEKLQAIIQAEKLRTERCGNNFFEIQD